MHVAPLFRDLIVLLTASLPFVFVCRRLGLPALCGFLLTGVLIGPSAAGIVQSPERVALLAEIGVVLLLFTIGLEFSLDRLTRMSRTLLGCGSLQVVTTVVVAFLGCVSFGYPADRAIVIAFVVSLSSTAVTLTLLQGRAELEAPQGRLLLAVLLFQDLCVLPMMLVLPVLARSADATAWDVIARMAVALAIIGAVVYAAKTALPLLLRQVLRLRSRELFIGTVVVACFGTAYLTAELGLSLAIGAFLAGLLVSESEYSQQVVAEVLPLRDLFSSVFFVSIGMLLDFDYVLAKAGLIGSLVVAAILVKAAIGAAAVLPFRASPRIAVVVGFSLAQIGEFSFVLADEAHTLGVLPDGDFQLVLSVAVITMLLTPLVSYAANVVTASTELPGLAPDAATRAEHAPHGHVVVVGYGPHGRNLCRVLRQSGVPYSIVDLDPDAVATASAEGEDILYGDATRAVVLQHVHAESANAIVVTISYPAASRRVVALARSLNESAAIVVRTRYVSEIEELYELGATEVIPEEFETSMEMFARVLQCLRVPNNVIAAQVNVIRSEHYAMLRGSEGRQPRLESIYELFAAATTVTHLIREGSPAIGRPLGEVDLHGRSGADVIAVVRKGAATTDPGDDFGVERGDIFVMMGSHAQLADALRFLEPGGEE